jgi:hypothetical protein
MEENCKPKGLFQKLFGIDNHDWLYFNRVDMGRYYKGETIKTGEKFKSRKCTKCNLRQDLDYEDDWVDVLSDNAILVDKEWYETLNKTYDKYNELKGLNKI